MAKKRKKADSIITSISAWLFKPLLLIPWACLGASVGILIFQIFFWYKNDTWTPLRTSALLEKIIPPRFLQTLTIEDPLGLRQSVAAVLNVSLSAFLFTCGVILLAFTVLLITSIDKRASQKENSADNPYNLPFGYPI